MRPRALIEDLCVWTDPHEFIEKAEKALQAAQPYEFFSNPQMKKIQEAWIAARFLNHRAFELARLVSDNWPDLEVKTGETVLKYEITEAYDSTRRRAEEYRSIDNEGGPEFEEDPFEDWKPRVDRSIAALKDVIRKKGLKRYSEKVGLIVYMSSAGSYGAYDHKVRKAAADAASADKAFSEIHVLGSDFYLSFYH